MKQHKKALAVIALLIAVSPCAAWGPHTHITRAALAVLPERERLEKYLGDDFDRLARDYVWMPDWREAVRPDHYADDYLLFPGMTKHLSHMLPEVRQTYEPYWRRALQAIRTESPTNAARWVGSLLHFVQDSGAPPHTTGIGGELHARMEQWVDESKISITGYRPRLLGKTAGEALRGFRDRMEELVAFSKVRAIKLKPLVENLKERVNQPLQLECALETAKVSADLVHTLFTLGLAEPEAAGCVLEGKIAAPSPAGYAKVPGHVMLAGTSFATTTAADGTFRFRNLPAGEYRVLVLATGYEEKELPKLTLKPDQPVGCEVTLTPDAVVGNLVRNPALRLRWLKKDEPDWWTRDPLKNGRWASALIRVPVAQKCRVRVEFQPHKQVPVAVRWRANPAMASDSREQSLPQVNVKNGILVLDIEPDTRLRPFEKGILFLEVLVEARSLPDAIRHVAVEYLSQRRSSGSLDRASEPLALRFQKRWKLSGAFPLLRDRRVGFRSPQRQQGLRLALASAAGCGRTFVRRSGNAPVHRKLS